MRTKGFTLVELLVVIAIIAILSVVGVTIYSGVQKNAQNAKEKADVDAIAKALEVKFSNTGSYQALDGSEFAGGVVPKTGSGEDYTVTINEDGKGFQVCTTLADDTQYCKESTQGTYRTVPGTVTPTTGAGSTPVVPPSPTSGSVAPPSGGGALDSPQTIKVLVINYFPLNPLNPTYLDGNEMHPDFAGVTLTSIRAQAASEVQNMVTSLTEASKFKGYKNPGATPYLHFSIVETKEYTKKIPRSTFLAWYKPGVYRPDLMKMLQGEGFNICDYVDNQGVTQVWLRGYQYGSMEPDESNMSMGTSSRSFWNWGTYGDVSNSQHFNDMPVCNKTYVLYGVGGLGNTLENHLHQIENIFIFADNNNLFRGNPGDNTFERPYGLTGGTVNHCGNVHMSPNTTIDYDWFSETTVKSDCEDWKPDGGGQVSDVNCHTWYGAGIGGLCRPVDDGGAKFKIWLMQNYAGYGNTLTYQGKRLRNWWEFYADFDAALARGKSLTIQTGVLGTNSSVINLDFSNIVHFIQSLFN